LLEFRHRDLKADTFNAVRPLPQLNCRVVFGNEVVFRPQTVGAARGAGPVDGAGVAAVHFPGRNKSSLSLRGSPAAKTSIIIAL